MSSATIENPAAAAATPFHELSENLDTASPTEVAVRKGLARWMIPLEVVSALLMTVIVVLLLGGVVSRYLFQLPIVWIDEVRAW